MLLWQEYKHATPEGINYSRFCELYRAYSQTLDPIMRQHHRAGERLFVDYAGMTFPIVEAATGEIIYAQIFVAAMGASSFTFAEATRSQAIDDWINSHQRAFRFFGGVPEIGDTSKCWGSRILMA
jgi:transposase